MGFLDKLRSSVGRLTTSSPRPAPADRARPVTSGGETKRPAASLPIPFLAPAKPPAGPLDLASGDFVTHYRERFAVVGIRVLEAAGVNQLHYCLRDANGAAAVLACEGGSDPSFSLQRAVVADVRWDTDEVTGVSDEPMRLGRSVRMKVRVWGDAGVPASTRWVVCRAYADASGERTLCLDDFEGTREVRLGDPVFEAEMEFERSSGDRTGGARTAALGGAKAFEDTAIDQIVKGSPRAAAKSLEENMGSKSLPPRAPDRDPTAYDDDTWADAADEVVAAAPARPKPVRKSHVVDDDDEWVSATQLVRENGEVGGDEDEYEDRRATKS